ncbi:helix-turn-helix domain-containing protein [Halorubrum halophilum]|uniref:helix-turn-helix domain-containing protein n=1 Tax=Halorubrum halophilum TaxID=413816 RepID=UPI001D008516|nr:helix-turn-helix domain-containing protein [Halorubrum halophilum]
MSEENDGDGRPTPPEGFRRVTGPEMTDEKKELLEVAPRDTDWMTDLDNQILYVLLTGLTLTPSVIADNLDKSRQAVSQRLNALRAGGLVRKEERGKYSLTEEGYAYTQVGEVKKRE